MSFWARGIQFIRENPSIITSLILVVFIPVSLFVHTFFTISSFRAAFDRTIIGEARTLALLIDGFVDDLSDKGTLERAIRLVHDQSSYLSAISFAVPSSPGGESFRIIAASDQQDAGKELKEVETVLAWNQDTPFGARYTLNREQFWIVVSPLHNTSGQKIGLAQIALSLNPISSPINAVTARSYMILIGVLAITFALLANHTRLFEYSVLYKKIQEVDQAKNEFISMASHELRAPVTGIAMFLHMARDKTFGPITKEMEGKLNETIHASEHLDLLIEDMLEVSRIEQKEVKLQMNPTDIIPLCGEIIDSLTPIASAKGITLLTKFSFAAILLNIDPARFKQVLLNLLGNAIKYTSKGEITLETSEKIHAKEIAIKVIDSGMGIAAEDQAYLFQKFFRAPNRETRDERGTGLGLWISKQLTEMMGGKVLLESIRGKGSVFTLVFPLAPKKTNVQQNSEVPPPH